MPFQKLPEKDMAADELPRPPPRISKEKHITYRDLNRSIDLMIYGFRHRITDCDQFTNDFLKAQGIQVNPKEPEPEDAFGDYRRKVLNSSSKYFSFFAVTNFFSNLSPHENVS